MIKSIDEEDIYYEDIGTGDITLIPVAGLGTPTGRIVWRHQLSLSDTFRIVLIDYAGFGKSSKTRRNYTMELFAQDIKVVVETLDLQNIILLGASMGGAIILEIELLISARIKGLISFDSLFPGGYNKIDESKLDGELEPFKEDFTSAWTNLVNALLTDKLSKLDADMFRNLGQELDQRATISAYQELLLWDMDNLLQKIKNPLKCIVAGNTLPDKNRRKNYNKIFDTIYAEGSGHLMYFEEPERFNQLLLSRIQEIININ